MHPADCIGEVGAASGALLIACAAAALAKAPPGAAPALLWTAADTDHRMALTLEQAANAAPEDPGHAILK